MFGTLPPQTLYHTRSVHVEPGRGHAGSAPSTPRASGALALRGRSTLPIASESRERLLRTSLDGSDAYGAAEDESLVSGSPEFRHYQQSISSLGAMIDRVCMFDRLWRSG